jgi:uncharacterized protein YdcH (DUF465 family)
MPSSPEELRQSLLARDPEFRNLAEEHSRCESQLELIVKAMYLNSEDLTTEVELKKLKLRLRDRMESILARHLQTVSH